MSNNNNKATPPTTLTIKGIPTNHIHEAAYYRGYRDFVRGLLDCPYRKDTLLAKEWFRGQNSAYFKNREMLLSGSLMRMYYSKKKFAQKKNNDLIPT